jgi:RimJ/RimL family protein N-acetyltransferase
MQSLTTPRLGLRPFEADDFEFLVALNGDPDVARYIGYCVPRTREETRHFFEATRRAYAEDGLGHLAVYLRSTGELVGRCGLSPLEVETEPAVDSAPRWYWFRGSAPPDMAVRHEVELGYTFAKAHWGLGFATEAATAVRDHAFRDRGYDRLASAIIAENVRSSRVSRKLGFRHTGQLSAFDKTYERYELTRDDWLGAA